METNNKIALITGGSRGLGKSAALRLAERGTDVIITYLNNPAAAEAVVAAIEQGGRKAAALRLDTGNSGSFDSFIAELRNLLQQQWNRATFDFLVNNAGINEHAPFAATTEAAFDHLFNVHFKGVYFLTQQALPLIADGGRIVNVSTGLTRFATPVYSAYASMKGAIETLTKYMAKELGGRRINVNVVAPGPVETDFTDSTFSDHPGMKDFLASQTALGRIGVTEDISGVVAFLCSEDARWVNAQRIEASGGIFL